MKNSAIKIKQMLLAITVLLFCCTFLGVFEKLYAIEKNEVSYRYRNESLLTEEEKSQLTYEQPPLLEKENQTLHLVYRKMHTLERITTEHLPIHFVGWAMLLLLIVFSVYFKKHRKTFFAFAMFLTVALLLFETVSAFLGTENLEKYDTTLKISEQENSLKKFKNYIYEAYFIETKDAAEEKNSVSTSLSENSSSEERKNTTETPPVNSQPSVPTPPVNSQPSVPTPPVNSQPSVLTPPVNSQPSVPTPPVNSQPSVPTPPVNTQPSVPTPPVNTQPSVPTPPVNNQPSVPTPPVNSQPNVPTLPEQETEATRTQPRTERLEKAYGETVHLDEVKEKVKDLPSTANLSLKENTNLPDGRTAGDHAVTLVVRYADGSTEEVMVTVHIQEQAHKDRYTPVAEILTLAYGTPTETSTFFAQIQGIPAEARLQLLTAFQENREGEQNLEIKVVYADNTEENVNLRVVVEESQATRTQPRTERLEKAYGETVHLDEVKEKVKDLPSTANLSLKENTNLPDGRTAGDHVVTLVIRYADGSTEEVMVTVHIQEQPHKDRYTPVAETLTLAYGTPTETSTFFAQIQGIPAEARLQLLTAFQENREGEQNLEIKVVYADNTEENVNLRVVVEESQATRTQPRTERLEKAYGETVHLDEVKEKVKDLPSTANLSLKENTNLPDGRTAGDHAVTLVVRYADGSTEEVIVFVHIQEQAHKDRYTPVAETLTLAYGTPTETSTFFAQIQGIPAEARLQLLTAFQENREGEQNLEIKVVYADNTEENVNLRVVVEESQATRTQPRTERLEKAYGETVHLDEVKEKVKDLPSTANLSLKENTNLPDGRTAGDHAVTLVVRYADGSTEEVMVTVHIQEQPHKDRYTPVAETLTLAYGTPTETSTFFAQIQGIPAEARLQLLTAFQENREGEQNLEIKVVYADNTEENVNLRVVVEESQATRTQPRTERLEKAYGETVHLDEVKEKVKDLPSTANLSLKENTNLPDGRTAGDHVVTLVVRYADGSTEEVMVTVHIQEQVATEKPSLALTNLQENVAERSVDVTYSLEDPHQNFVKVQLRLFRENEKIAEKEITDKNALAQISFDNLELSVPYRLETLFFYRNPQEKNESLEDVSFELLEKSIEWREYRNLSLHKITEEGDLTAVTALRSLPSKQDLANYVVKVQPVSNKEMLWSVDEIIEENGKFTVLVKHPKLVQYNAQTQSLENHHRFTLEKVVEREGAYSSFSALIDAMNQNRQGTFYLASDMVVDREVDTATYVTGEFTGRLYSAEENKTFSISGLKKPLFDTLKNARVENIALKNVDLQGNQKEVGALAKTANASTIQKVQVQGNLHVLQNVGGVVYQITNGTQLNELYVDVHLKNSASHETHFMGGVVAKAYSSQFNKIYAKVRLEAETRGFRGQRVGGLAAEVSILTTLPSLQKIYVVGEIHTTEDVDEGGLCAVSRYASIQDALVGVRVTQGHKINAIDSSAVKQNIKTIRSLSEGLDTPGLSATECSEEEAETQATQWNLLRPQEKQTETSASAIALSQSIDYTSLPQASSERRIAYQNMAKLLPFYDRYTLVKYGNKVPENSKLYTTEILSLVPMKDDVFVSDLYSASAEWNALLVHYADESKEILPLVYKGPYENTSVVEYVLGEDLLYTPEQLLSLDEHFVEELKTEIAAVRWQTETMASLLGVHSSEANKAIKMKELYMEESFDKVQTDMSTHIKSFLSHQAVSENQHPYLLKYWKKKLLQDKEKWLFGLTYLQRLYNVSYGSYKILPLVLHYPHFYGKTVDAVEWLKGFAEPLVRDLDDIYLNDSLHKNMYFDRKKIGNNPEMYEKRFAPITKNLSKVKDFLEYHHRLFVPEKEKKLWFKEASKAFIYEVASQEDASLDTSLYTHLSRIPRFEKYYLPFLSLQKENEIFIVSTMSTLTMGGYGRYVDTALKESDPSEYYRRVEQVQTERIPKHANRLGRFLDMWYRLAKPDYKSKYLEKSTEIWDGYWILDSLLGENVEGRNERRRWVGRFDPSYAYVKELAGPMEEWHASNPGKKDNAFANLVSFIKFSYADLLSDAGDSTLSHELVHNYARSAILDGFDLRPDQDDESYAMGLLQSSSGGSIYYYGFNFMYENNPRTVHNVSNARFQSREDLQTYMRGLFDATYLLDAAEAEVLLTYPKADQKHFFNKIVLVKESPTTQQGSSVVYQHAHDEIRALTEEEWASLQLRTLEDLIDQQLVAKSSFLYPKKYLRENLQNYYFVPLVQPIYAALQNDTGTVGGLQFRKTAFELLAEKGWEEGFVPYVSNKYQAEAEAQNLPLSDQYVFAKIFGATYTDFKAFKKAMFAKRLEKKDLIRPIQIAYEGQNYEITNYAELKNVLALATQKDLNEMKLNRASFERQRLKENIIKAWNQATDSFSQSIFRE